MVWGSQCSSNFSCLPPDKEVRDLWWVNHSRNATKPAWESFLKAWSSEQHNTDWMVRRPGCSLGSSCSLFSAHAHNMQGPCSSCVISVAMVTDMITYGIAFKKKYFYLCWLQSRFIQGWWCFHFGQSVWGFPYEVNNCQLWYSSNVFCFRDGTWNKGEAKCKLCAALIHW